MTPFRTTSDDPRRPGPRSLWGPGDVLGAALPFAVGVTAWLVAWFQVSGQASYSKQIGWLDLAVAGLIVATTSQLVWLLRGRRAVGEMRRRLLRVHVSAAPRLAPVPLSTRRAPSPPAPDSGAGIGLRVAGPDMTLFHRVDCVMVRGRQWSAVSVEDHLAAGRTPCGICDP